MNTIGRFWPLVVLLMLMVAVGTPRPGHTAPERAGDQIGAVTHAQGVTQARQNDTLRDLHTGGDVLTKDTLLTGAKSRLKVDFKDGSELYLGDNSKLAIDDMIYEPHRHGQGTLWLTRGVFRMVTGQINKVPDGALSVITPFATIGVRGTDFWGQQSADKLVMAVLGHGELYISTPDGTVRLTQPYTFVTIEKGKPPSPVEKLGDQQLKDAVATVSW